MRRSGAGLSAVVFGLFLLTGCGGGGGRSDGAGAPADKIPPKLSAINSPGGATLGPKSALVVTFDEPVQPQTLILGGTMAPESDGGVWSSSAAKPSEKTHSASGLGNDRLTIGPKSAWSGGAGRTLSINVKDLAGNPIQTVQLSYTIDIDLPTASAMPPSGSPLAKGEAITLLFSKSMQPSTLSLGGDLGATSDGGVWSTTTRADDTVTLRPGATWPIGAQTLTVGATDTLGNEMAPLLLTLPVVEGVLHVSPAGDDANDGTKTNPKKTIPAAIAEGVNLNLVPVAVLVSEGTYLVDSGGPSPTQVVLAEGVSLYGGYSADFSRRDPSAQAAVIQDLGADAANSGNPHRAIEAGSGITPSTVVDGFTVIGGAGPYSSGIFNHDGGAPTLTGNSINGGRGSIQSIGIQNNASSPSIRNNTIHGGGGESSHGIFNTASSPTVENNIVDGGQGTTSYGVRNLSSSPLIRNNTVRGGSGGAASYGVYNVSSAPAIRGNTLHGGGGSSNSTGLYNNASSPTVENNTINGGSGGNNSMGIFSSSGAPLIRSNTVDGGEGGISYGILNQISSATIRNNAVSGGRGRSLSQGILNNGGAPVIQNNTINGGSGSFSYGILNGSASPTIENNLVFTSGNGTRYCIVETTSNADPVSLRNNDLFDCPAALYGDEGFTNKLTSIDAVNALADTAAGENVSIDPAFVDKDGADEDLNTLADNDWHLSSASPASVTGGGLDLSNDFTDDKEGVTRTLPQSIGAYERD